MIQSIANDTASKTNSIHDYANEKPFILLKKATYKFFFIIMVQLGLLHSHFLDPN